MQLDTASSLFVQQNGTFFWSVSRFAYFFRRDFSGRAPKSANVTHGVDFTVNATSHLLNFADGQMVFVTRYQSQGFQGYNYLSGCSAKSGWQ